MFESPGFDFGWKFPPKRLGATEAVHERVRSANPECPTMRHSWLFIGAKASLGGRASISCLAKFVPYGTLGRETALLVDWHRNFFSEKLLCLDGALEV